MTEDHLEPPVVGEFARKLAAVNRIMHGVCHRDFSSVRCNNLLYI
nr:MAG TPA: hypothetical protein [Caudoviricetes sp.]